MEARMRKMTVAVALFLGACALGGDSAIMEVEPNNVRSDATILPNGGSFSFQGTGTGGDEEAVDIFLVSSPTAGSIWRVTLTWEGAIGDLFIEAYDAESFHAVDGEDEDDSHEEIMFEPAHEGFWIEVLCYNQGTVPYVAAV